MTSEAGVYGNQTCKYWKRRELVKIFGQQHNEWQVLKATMLMSCIQRFEQLSLLA